MPIAGRNIVICFTGFRHIVSLLMLIILVHAAGCTTENVYTSTIPPRNLTSRPGEIYGEGGWGTNGGHATAGFSVGPFLQFAGAYTQHNDEIGGMNYKGGEEDFIVRELMIGAYFPFADTLVLEAFGGAGFGTTKTKIVEEVMYLFKDNEVRAYYNLAEYYKTFLQFNIGFRKSYYAYGWAIRATRLNYHNITKIDVAGNTIYKGSEEGIIFEPGLFLNLGNSPLKFGFYAGTCFGKEMKNVQWSFFTVALSATLAFGF